MRSASVAAVPLRRRPPRCVRFKRRSAKLQTFVEVRSRLPSKKYLLLIRLCIRYLFSANRCQSYRYLSYTLVLTIVLLYTMVLTKQLKEGKQRPAVARQKALDIRSKHKTSSAVVSCGTIRKHGFASNQKQSSLLQRLNVKQACIKWLFITKIFTQVK